MDTLHLAGGIDAPETYLSPLRGKLDGYDNAYRVALNMTAETSEDHLVIATGTAFQPHAVIRASDVMPCGRLHDVVRFGWIIAHVQAAA